MESFKVSHDSLFKNTLRILHEGIRHDLSIQTQDEILTCNRAFLELYPSLKEKIDDSSQMLQLHNIFFCVQLLRMTSNGKFDMLQGIGIHSVYRHSPCYFCKGQAVTQCQWIKIQLVHLNLCLLYCIALNWTRLCCDKQFSMIAQFCRGSWQNKPSQLPWLVWPIYSRQGCCLPLRK